MTAISFMKTWKIYFCIMSDKENIILMGDLNARIGNQVAPGIVQKYNEETRNDNIDRLLSLCIGNELRINNTISLSKFKLD